MKKILASDFDFTYFNNFDDLYKNNDAVNQFREKGNLFVIATGRYYSSIKPFIDTYDIKFDYLVCSDGSIIFDSNFNVIYETAISLESVLKIVEILKTNDVFDDWFIDTSQGLSKDLKQSTNSIIGSYKDYYKAKEILDKLLLECNDINGYISRNWVNISSKTTNKAMAILFLADMLNIDPNDIYAIGDGINDLEMIKTFNSAIMSNSIDDLKRLNKNQYDAVYQFIGKLK